VREQAMSTMSLSLYSLPDDLQLSFRVSLECAELSRRAGLRSVEETSLLNAVETGIDLGRFSDVEPILGAIETRGPLARNVTWATMLRAMLTACRGDVVTAQRLVAEVATTQSMREFIAGQTTVLASRSLVSYLAGEMSDGVAQAAEAVDLEPLGINAGAAILHHARSAIWLKDADELRGVLEAAAKIRGRRMAAVRLEIQAAIAAIEGDTDDTADLYGSAVEAWRTMDCLLDAAVTELEAVHLLGPGHPQSEMAKEADDLLSEIDVPILLARLHEALGT
jgi:hypothetical protein